MALTSLVNLNRVGVYSYWNNIWDSSTLYSRYSLYSTFIAIFFNYFNNNKLQLNSVLNRNYNEQRYYRFNQNLINLGKNKFFILGKVWLLKYQSWCIISISLLPCDISIGYKNFLFFKKTNLFFYVLNKRNKVKSLNYKYRI